MRNTFPKSLRVTKNSDFRQIITNGFSVGGKHIRIFYRKRKGPRARFGITISRKIKGAVLRNRCKRIIREFVRLEQNQIAEDADIIVLLKIPPIPPKFPILALELRNLFERAGLVKAGK